MRRAYIGMGGNLASAAGAPEATLAAAVRWLESLGCVVCRSPLYSTAPVGLSGQPRFVNAVVEVATDLAARELLAGLQAIELEFGRNRSAGIANGPRTLDLDLLLMDELEVSEPGLELPHPRLAERAFVLVPLNEIAALRIVPGRGKTVAELLAGLPASAENAPNAVVRIEYDGWRARKG
ncbi:MAG: 2-amino-4-hydroxy-6-hydroxymethyldihydropteridine diphosphokinase [Terracidiphilus sp.]